MIQKSCDKKSYELPLSFVRFLSTVFTVQIFNAHIFYQQQGSIFLLLFSPNHAVACCYFSNVVSILKIVRVSGLFCLSRDSSRTPSMLQKLHTRWICFQTTSFQTCYDHDYRGYIPTSFIVRNKDLQYYCIYFITPAL